MKRKLIVGLAICVVAVLGLDRLAGASVIGDGAYRLAVNIDSPSGPPLRVSCEAIYSRDAAEAMASQLKTSTGSIYTASADPFDGQPILVWVATSCGISILGRTVYDSQFRDLVVIATMPDGRRIGKVVRIPDRRTTKEVTVSFP